MIAIAMTADACELPDLQQTVAQHGGYDKIPPAAWVEFDTAIAQWRIDRLLAMGLSPINREEMNRHKRKNLPNKQIELTGRQRKETTSWILEGFSNQPPCGPKTCATVRERSR